MAFRGRGRALSWVLLGRWSGRCRSSISTVPARKTNGSVPSFIFPCLDRRWELGKAGAAAYASTRRKLALICTGLDGPGGEKYTLHSPKNFLPTAATQMNLSHRELNAIGHWPSGSRMNERYDRSVCVCVRTNYSFATP